jgi:hypothetical protein
MPQASEHDFENEVVRLFEEHGYDCEYGPNLERETSNPVLESRLVSAIERINNVDKELAEKAREKIKTTGSKNLRKINRSKYKEHVSTGLQIETDKNGDFQTIYLLDFDNPKNNDFLIINQFPIKYQNNDKQVPDLVLFVNGLPFGVIELKGTDECANSLEEKYKEIKNQYIEKAPNLFYYNQFIAVASRDETKVGSYTAHWKRMLPWRYIEKEPQNKGENEYGPEYVSLIEGFCEQNRLVDIIQNFVLYEEGGSFEKVIPTYYQYYGVKSAIESSIGKVGVQSSNNPESRRLGIYSYSQDSENSISIVYYIKYLKNIRPKTLFVLLDDTNNSDNQIHKTLEIFGINYKHISDTRQLRKELKEYQDDGPGVIITTRQKLQLLPSKRARKKLNKLKRLEDSFRENPPEDNLSEKYRIRTNNPKWYCEIVDSSHLEEEIKQLNDILDDIKPENKDKLSNLYGRLYNIVTLPISVDSLNKAISDRDEYYYSIKKIMKKIDQITENITEDYDRTKIRNFKIHAERLVEAEADSNDAEKSIFSKFLGDGERVKLVVKNPIHKEALEKSLTSEGYESEGYKIVTKKNLEPESGVQTIFTFSVSSDDWFARYPASEKNTVVCYNIVKHRFSDLDFENENHLTTEKLTNLEPDFGAMTKSNKESNTSHNNRTVSEQNFHIKFSDGNEKTVDEHYRPIDANDRSSRIVVSDLQEGDKILVTDTKSRKEDFYLSSISSPEHKRKYELALYAVDNFRQHVQNLIEEYDTYEDLVEAIRDNGGEVESASSISSWAHGRVHGPRNVSDIKAVLELSGISTDAVERYEEDFNYIRKMNVRIGKAYNEIFMKSNKSTYIIESSGSNIKLENADKYFNIKEVDSLTSSPL